MPDSRELPEREAAPIYGVAARERSAENGPTGRRMTVALSAGALVSAVLAIWPPDVTLVGMRAAYVFKPLSLLLLVALAATSSAPAAPRYRWGLVAGLLCSMMGDVFLMLPQDLFLPGLGCFLVAHVCYLAAFTADCRLGARRLPFAFSGIVGVMLVVALWPGIPPALRLPVVLYAGVLLAMAAQAVGRAVERRTFAARAAGVGAVLFVISDAVLALNRFGQPFSGASALILIPYFAGQWLIALSVGCARVKPA